MGVRVYVDADTMGEHGLVCAEKAELTDGEAVGLVFTDDEIKASILVGDGGSCHREKLLLDQGNVLVLFLLIAGAYADVADMGSALPCCHLCQSVPAAEDHKVMVAILLHQLAMLVDAQGEVTPHALCLVLKNTSHSHCLL